MEEKRKLTVVVHEESESAGTFQGSAETADCVQGHIDGPDLEPSLPNVVRGSSWGSVRALWEEGEESEISPQEIAPVEKSDELTTEGKSEPECKEKPKCKTQMRT